MPARGRPTRARSTTNAGRCAAYGGAPAFRLRARSPASVAARPSVRTLEKLFDRAIERPELRARPVANPRDLDWNDGLNPPGTRGHHDDTVGEVDRFGDAVGHEDDRLPLTFP